LSNASNTPRRPNVATLDYLRANDAPISDSGAYGESARAGISFFRAPDLEAGMRPNCRQQCCPRIGWKYLTTVIFFVDTLILIIELIVGSAMYGCAFDSANQMGGPSTTTLFCFGGKWEYDIQHGSVWRLLTPIFLHAGILHLATNMFMLLRFGYVLEDRWGTLKFGLVYLLTGINASLWSSVIGPRDVSVGASGALMGIMGADIAYLLYNYHEIPDIKIEGIFLTILIIINFFIGLSGVGIDNAAHLGGLITGLPLGVALVPHIEKRDNEKTIRTVAWIVFVGLFILFCLLLWVGKPDGPEVNFQCGTSRNTCTA